MRRAAGLALGPACEITCETTIRTASNPPLATTSASDLAPGFMVDIYIYICKLYIYTKNNEEEENSTQAWKPCIGALQVMNP